MKVRVARRDAVDPLLAWSAPAAMVVAALVVGGLILAAGGTDPLRAFGVMFVSPFTTPQGVYSVLVRTVPLLLTALAVYVPLRAGLWNIGAEGQLYVGAIVGTWLGLTVHADAVVLLPLMIVGAAVAGGLWGAIPGVARSRWNANEIIVTLLLTFVAQQFTAYLVQGPMRGPSGFPATANLPAAGLLPTFVSPQLHAGIALALLIFLAVHVLLEYTAFGFEMIVVGSNPAAAGATGIDRRWVVAGAMALAGAVAGVAGVVEIAGVQTKLQAGFSPGYGFTAIPIALLGRNGTFRVLAGSVFFAVLFVGGSYLSTRLGVSRSIVQVLQALIILFYITAEFFRRYELRVDSEAPVEDVDRG